MHTSLWSDISLSSLVHTLLTILCLSPPLTKNPSNSCHLPVAGCLHVPLLLYLIKLLTCAIPISSHQSTKSLPASFPLPRPCFPHMLPLSPPLPMLALKSPPNNNPFPVPHCHLPFHIPSASFHAFPILPSLAGIPTPVSIPPPPPLPPSPQTTSSVPLPPTFLALLPLTSLLPSSRGSAPPFPRPPPTRPFPPHLPLAQLATPSLISPASPSPPHFSAFYCLSPSHSTSSHSRSRPTATPSTPKYQPPPPPPTVPPSCPPPPPFPPSLISSSSTLPPAPNSPSCKPRVGMDPHQTVCHQHPPLSLPYPPQAPDQPKRDAPNAGPRRAPAIVWFRVGSSAPTPFPHRSVIILIIKIALQVLSVGCSSSGSKFSFISFP